MNAIVQAVEEAKDEAPVKLKVAQLDEDGVFIGMAEVHEKDLTDCHLAQIPTCDLPEGEYKWIEDKTNPMGGAFWPIVWLDKIDQAEQAAVQSRAAKANRQQRLATRATERAERRAIQLAKRTARNKS